MKISSLTSPGFTPFFDNFADPKLEQEYRLSRLSSDWRQVRFFAATALPFLLLFSLNDILGQGWIPAIYGITTVRCVWAIASIVLIALGSRSKSLATLDTLTTAYMFSAAAMGLYISQNRPVDSTETYVTGVIILFAMYNLFPITLRYRCFAALFFSIGSLLIFFTYTEPVFAASNFAIPMAFVFSNVFAFFCAQQYGRIRRTQYLRMLEEHETVAELEKTLANLKTLTGLIPICAWCNKIRDDKGYWNDIEEYVSSHSEAELSLGTCIECQREADTHSA